MQAENFIGRYAVYIIGLDYLRTPLAVPPDLVSKDTQEEKNCTANNLKKKQKLKKAEKNRKKKKAPGEKIGKKKQHLDTRETKEPDLD